MINLLAIIDQAVNVVNSIPYSLAQSNLVMSPDMLMRPYRHLLQTRPMDSDGLGPELDIDVLWKELSTYTQFCEDARDKIIKSKTERFKQKFRKGTLDLSVKVDDICFIVSEKGKKGRLCRVHAIHGNKATVYLADTRQFKEYPVTHLNVMVADRRENDNFRDTEIENDGQSDEIPQNWSRQSGVTQSTNSA